jgi:putative DNA primase/helicase
MSACPAVEPISDQLRPLALGRFIALDIPARAMLLAPIIPEGGLVMLHAARGVGKTHVAHGIAHAVASGSAFLKWRAPRPRRVLLIDGEMPAALLRERFLALTDGALPANLDVLAGDLTQGGIGDFAAPGVRAGLEPLLADVDLLVLDHLASLTASMREQGWTPLQDWLLGLRQRGTSVLIVHHAGRNGEPRGTPRREDMLDTSIALRRPVDYHPREGARFEVHMTKGRGLYGEAASPFEAWLARDDGGSCWRTRTMVDAHGMRVAALLNDGLSIREVAAETGLSKSTVHRLKRRMEEEAARREAAEAGSA